jgi:hypothetical protein
MVENLINPPGKARLLTVFGDGQIVVTFLVYAGE